jgi:hypothetical protein
VHNNTYALDRVIQFINLAGAKGKCDLVIQAGDLATLVTQ